MFINKRPDVFMHLKIEQNRTLEELQADFNNAYPYLKIEFFRNGNVLQSTHPAPLLLDKRLYVKDAQRINNRSGELSIPDNMTVAELENDLRKQFGLSVQIFRKSGKLWLETTMTDHWTLKQQNEHGKEISSPPGKKG